jgi:hypothetical protein
MTDAEAREYKRLKDLENLLLKDPKTEREFYEVLDRAGLKVPKLDTMKATESAIDEKLKKHSEEVAALQKKLIEREAGEENEKQIGRLKRAPYNLDDDEINEVRNLVVEASKQGEYVSLERMAKFYIAQHSPVSARSVSSPFSTKLHRPKNDFRKLLRDPKSKLLGPKAERDQYLRQEFDDAWDEGLELINNQQTKF